MIEEVELKPSVSALIQSLRSIGYSFNAAVSDIIDNSIAANASEINVQIDSDSAGLFVAISDNGEGMNRDELLQAMALGSKNPLEKRRNDDLGRFGMGLKTASFSQSKILTCVTSKSGKRIGAQWDLDRVVDGWKIQLFDDSACDQLVPSDLTHQDRGTTVVWSWARCAAYHCRRDPRLRYCPSRAGAQHPEYGQVQLHPSDEA